MKIDIFRRILLIGLLFLSKPIVLLAHEKLEKEESREKLSSCNKLAASAAATLVGGAATYLTTQFMNKQLRSLNRFYQEYYPKDRRGREEAIAEFLPKAALVVGTLAGVTAASLGTFLTTSTKAAARKLQLTEQIATEDQRIKGFYEGIKLMEKEIEEKVGKKEIYETAITQLNEQLKKNDIELKGIEEQLIQAKENLNKEKEWKGLVGEISVMKNMRAIYNKLLQDKDKLKNARSMIEKEKEKYTESLNYIAQVIKKLENKIEENKEYYRKSQQKIGEFSSPVGLLHTAVQKGKSLFSRYAGQLGQVAVEGAARGEEFVGLTLPEQKKELEQEIKELNKKQEIVEEAFRKEFKPIKKEIKQEYGEESPLGAEAEERAEKAHPLYQQIRKFKALKTEKEKKIDEINEKIETSIYHRAKKGVSKVSEYAKKLWDEF